MALILAGEARSGSGPWTVQGGRATMGVVSQRDVEIIRRGYAAFLEGDVEAAFGVFADDIEVLDDPGSITAGRYRGREGFARLLAATTEGFEDVAYHADAFFDAGGAVLVEARRSGKGVASGVAVEERQYHVWDMKDGQAVRFRLFLVKEDALAAIG